MNKIRKFFKWLLAVDIIIFIGGFIFLRILALFFGATKGGRNSGMFSDEAFLLILVGIGAPAIIVAGIIFGIVLSFFKRKSSINTN